MQWFIKEQVEEVATMSDLLRVVERSRDDVMEVENYMAREQSGGEGERPDRAASPPALEPQSDELRAPRRRPGMRRWRIRSCAGSGDGSLRRGGVPLLHPPGLPVPDRLRAAAVAGRRAGAAAGVDAAFAGLASSVLETEMALHREFAARWGVADLEAERAAPATSAYCNFLLRTASLGDFAELARGGAAVHVELRGDRRRAVRVGLV